MFRYDVVYDPENPRSMILSILIHDNIITTYWTGFNEEGLERPHPIYDDYSNFIKSDKVFTLMDQCHYGYLQNYEKRFGKKVSYQEESDRKIHKSWHPEPESVYIAHCHLKHPNEVASKDLKLLLEVLLACQGTFKPAEGEVFIPKSVTSDILKKFEKFKASNAAVSINSNCVCYENNPPPSIYEHTIGVLHNYGRGVFSLDCTPFNTNTVKEDYANKMNSNNNAILGIGALACCLFASCYVGCRKYGPKLAQNETPSAPTQKEMKKHK